jgi:hypothetical protein
MATIAIRSDDVTEMRSTSSHRRGWTAKGQNWADRCAAVFFEASAAEAVKAPALFRAIAGKELNEPQQVVKGQFRRSQTSKKGSRSGF